MINIIDLTGKKIIITGASSGIGKATAIQLSKVGAKIIMVSRNEDKMMDTLSQMEGDGHAYYPFDLKNIGELESLIKKIVSDFGGINGCVHCAGTAPMRPISKTKYDFTHDVMLINFYSFVEMVRCLSKKNNYIEGASFIAMSSIASRVGYKSKVAYCASKGALDSAIRCLAKELASKKIRVNSIVPGWVATEMYTEYLAEHGTSEDAVRISESQYLGAIDPVEIANVVAYLLSDVSKTITGTGLVIDGGWLS